MRFLTILMAATVAATGMARAGTENANPMACVQAGAWVDTASRAPVAGRDVLARSARGSIVLLGESHDNADHHRWQLQTITALRALGGAVTLGFEMFPRSVQSVLDAWVAGDYDEPGFLEAVDWDRVWGYEAALYMPLFHFARINRIPMIALNVERDLISSIRERGWDAVPEAMREGVTDPAPPDPAYRASLETVYEEHLLRAEKEPDPSELKRFIAAQLTWDRAMAQALAAANADTLVIGVIGGGHLENRWGVPHQLAALGRTGVSVLLPWDRGRDCADLTAALADAVFGLDPPLVVEGGAPWRPRLGVMIRSVEGAVRVLEVVEGSVAETAGLLPDDVIISAAGVAVAEADELVAVIGRQAPGTWLPLVLERKGESLDIIAKFPNLP